jgi:cysteine desulfuration protein SufE
MTYTLPEKLQTIVDDFALASREEKVEMLIQYAESLPALPERLRAERDKMEPVPECMAPVFLFGEKQAAGGLVFYFDIPPQSPTVRGLAAILANGLDGATPEEVIGLPADFYAPMNLQEAISFQRLNGFQGILAHMKQAAVRLMNS